MEIVELLILGLGQLVTTVDTVSRQLYVTAQANSVKGTAAGLISHEARGPSSNTPQAICELLLRDSAGGTREVRSFLGLVF